MLKFGSERLPKRFWDKVHADPVGGCWLFVAATDPNGYGKFRWGRGMRSAHHVTMEAAELPRPRGLVTDHLCRVRCCVNPDHLEYVTQGENVRRGDSPGALSVRTGECSAGHPLSGGNLVVRSDGWRQCRRCHNRTDASRRRTHYKALREAGASSSEANRLAGWNLERALERLRELQG